ncbi:unnamed protein product [Camellia sinensis]
MRSLENRCEEDLPPPNRHRRRISRTQKNFPHLLVSSPEYSSHAACARLSAPTSSYPSCSDPCNGGGIAIAPEVVNVIHAMMDQNKKDMRMLVQIASHRQHVNCIRGKRPLSEGSSSESSISFSDADLEGVDLPHNDALVISLEVGGHLVDRILVDPCIAVDIMYINLFKMLKLKLEDLKPTSTVLHGFNEALVQPMEVVTLLIYVEPVTVQTQFSGDRCIFYLLKFHPGTGIEAIRGDQKASKECCMIEVKAKEKEAKIVAASGIADGCMRSGSGPIAVFDFAKFAEKVERRD